MRRFSPSLLKAAWPYTVEDLSRVFGVSEASIRRLLKKYPEAIAGGSPQIIVGRVLKRALQAARKSKNPGLSTKAIFLCGNCNVLVRPAGQLVEAEPHNLGKTARLGGFCERCEGSVSRFVSLKDKEAFEADLGVATLGSWGD